MVSIGNDDMMPDCNHEEADTRIVVHVVHALNQGTLKVHVRTVDTDVIAILVGKYHDLVSCSPHADIVVAFGKGKDFIPGYFAAGQKR